MTCLSAMLDGFITHAWAINPLRALSIDFVKKSITFREKFGYSDNARQRAKKSGLLRKRAGKEECTEVISLRSTRRNVQIFSGLLMSENLFLMDKKIDIDFKLSVYDRVNEQRQEKVFCDVSLQIDGQLYPAHKNILAAASPYFFGLFTTDMQEKSSTTIKIEALSSKVIKEVLDYMYTGEIDIQFSNVKEIIQAADYLLIPSLKNLAISVLLENLSVENCFDFREIGIKFSSPALQDAADACIIKEFQAVSQTIGFKKLDLAFVEELLRRDDIGIEREEDVLNRVLDWVKYDLSRRKDYLPQLLLCVRLFFMSKFTLQECLQKEPLIQESVSCTSILLEGLQMHLFPDRALGYYQKPRDCVQTSDIKVAIITGGHNSRSRPIPRMVAYALPDGGWYSLKTEMSVIHRTRHCATVSGGCLYVLGGSKVWSIERFDVQANTWNTLCREIDIPSVKHSAIVSFEEKIFLFGGEKANSNSGSQVFDVVKEYNPKDHEWKTMSSMSCPRAAHCAVIIGTFVYVVGGYSEDYVYNTGERYNILTDKWEPIASMSEERFFAAGANLRGRVVIAGGYQPESRIAYSSCEIYNPETGYWDNLISMPIPRAACGVVQVEDDVFLFGGEAGSAPSDKLDSVVCYNGKDNSWRELADMPAGRSCLQACVLHLPKSVLIPLYDESDKNTDEN